MIATLACPRCGTMQTIQVPDEPLATHRCRGCGRTLTAARGEHCVLCSYADTTCQASTLVAT